MVVRKDWGSPVEMWVFKQFEKGSKAYTAFHVYLKSGQGLQLNRDVKCYFRDFAHFKEVILGLFFTKLRDPISVTEKNLKRIKLTLTGTDGPTTPTTLGGGLQHSPVSLQPSTRGSRSSGEAACFKDP
jgi:hypothetical protein